MSDITLETINAKLDEILTILHRLAVEEDGLVSDGVTSPGPADLR